MRLYVSGGSQRDFHKRTPDWKLALLLELDADSGRVERALEYVSPPEVCPEIPSITFKAASLAGGRLYICTQTEVLVYRSPGFRQEGYLSLPCFNDLHHVCPLPDGDLAVVSTGLDMVVQVDRDGNIKKQWNVLGKPLWERFSPDTDYRKVASTKPHDSHPNFAFLVGDDLWVTRCMQRDAVCLTRQGGRMEIDVEKPHDGIVRGHRVYFTTVNGNIVICDTRTGERLQVVDLNRINRSGMALGWCRGLEVLDDHRVVVGFSRLRPTRFVENVQWAKHMLGMRETIGDLPTRVALFDLKAGRQLWEVDLEPHGLNTVFSIHRTDPAP